jgi:hypothetical protein
LGLVRLCARPGSRKGGVVALPLRRLAWHFAVRHALLVKWCLPLPVKHALPFTVGVACHFWWCCLATICVCASRTGGSWLGLCCFRCASRFRSSDAAASVQVAPSTYGQVKPTVTRYWRGSWCASCDRLSPFRSLPSQRCLSLTVKQDRPIRSGIAFLCGVRPLVLPPTVKVAV